MKKLLVLLFALCSAQAFGQAYSSTVLQNSAGNYGRPVPYPQVLVCVSSDTNVPCVTRATTYSDDTLTTQCTQTGSSGLLIGNPTSGTNCNNPGIGDVNGNFTIYVAGGEYVICTYSGTWLCQKQTIANGTSGGSGNIAPCSLAGCDTYYPLANTPAVAGDASTHDDGSGNKQAKSIQFTQVGAAGFWYVTQGTPPATTAANSIYFYAPVSVSTYAWVLPGSAGSGCLQGANTSGVVTISFTGVACGSGSGATLQTNTVNNTSQALLNFTNSPSITASNPSGGIEQFSIFGAGTLNNPSTPTVTPTGTTGSTAYTYGIVGCEDASCAYHSAIVTGSTSTGNATLTTSNYNALTAYGDTLYGYRGYVICRTAGGATQGRITGAVQVQAGKKFNDTGLSGDGANCATIYASATANTVTYPVCLGSSLPGYPSVPGPPCGVDGPPLTPNALDDEYTPTFGAPGDVNSPFWTRVNFGASTSATWSNGEIILADPSASSTNWRLLTITTPSTPWTFVLTAQPQFVSAANGGLCLYDGTKVENIIYQASTTGLFVAKYTNVTTFSGTAFSFPASTFGQNGWLYLKVQDTGSNLVFSYSGDGVNYVQGFTEAVGTFMTPTSIGPCLDAEGNTKSTMSFDYFRRTQ